MSDLAMPQAKAHQTISLRILFSRFRWRIALTVVLVLAESGLNLLFPLLIGFAINGLLEQNTDPLAHLGLLGVITLIVGSGRRFYDTRAFAGIYTAVSTEMVEREQQKGTPLSAIATRSGLLTEFVEFLENSMPMILESLIGIVGVLLIILNLNASVFAACLALVGLIALVYLASGKWNFSFNQGYNDELEKRVEVLSSHQLQSIAAHFKRLMIWNIRLSDLETLNYAIVWLGIIALLIYSPITVIESGVINYGLVFSVLMYVFQYIESLVSLPLFIQQIIRLQEITQRLRN
ncbi:MAG: ABC transporter six-transmembrane domain-containing protein [Chloroflexi bacterium]|nr:ABC transporter six-transmembrane domain-containing protein [Chloroflexota bacterium]